MDQLDRIAGTLLGAAVGDALGLPREGLSRRRAERLYGSGPVCHRFLFRRGMVSDDTEHACMTAQALLAAPENSESFARSLAWRLRGWILGVPAGIGWGTLRAILKLWIGFSPERSGVASAGNGPAMRSPILGVCLGNDPEKLETYVGASTRNHIWSVAGENDRDKVSGTFIQPLLAYATHSVQPPISGHESHLDTKVGHWPGRSFSMGTQAPMPRPTQVTHPSTS